MKRNRGAPPAPVVEYIAPGPAVISSPEPVVEYLAPAPAVIQSVTPVMKSSAPAPAVISSPEPVLEYFAPAPAVIFSVVESIAPAPAVFQAPEPVVEYLAPAPAVSESPAPVVYFSPAPAVFQAPVPVVEYLAPAPAVIPLPAPVVEYISPVPVVFHAPVFPLSPDASDMSAPEDTYTSPWVSLPVPIKNCTVKCQCGGRGPGVRDTDCDARSMTSCGQPRQEVGFAQWLRKEAARRGYAWRQQRRVQQLACYVLRACLLVTWWERRLCGLRLLGQASC